MVRPKCVKRVLVGVSVEYLRNANGENSMLVRNDNFVQKTMTKMTWILLWIVEHHVVIDLFLNVIGMEDLFLTHL